MIRIGTSGYDYFWNEGKPTKLQWYLNQGFNTVEINSSFYRFPMKTWAKTWLKSPEDFDFTIKVHRSITHYARLSDRGLELLDRFTNTLKDMKHKITFWLFQMPPTFVYNEKNSSKLVTFFTKAKLNATPVIEFRHKSWWDRKDMLNNLNCVFCSVDAPELPNEIVSTNKIIYIRLHGREAWYDYEYDNNELDDILERARKLKPKKCYIYLNNDTGMLSNGLYLLEKAKSLQTIA